MGWRRVADILMGMQARDVVVKASYARALNEEREKLKNDARTELNNRYLSIQEKCKKYPELEEDRQAFLKAYPVMKNIEFQYKMGVLQTPILRGYIDLFYYHLSKVKLEEAKEAAKPPIPDIPDIPGIPDINIGLPELPSWPDLSGLKGSLQVIALVFIAVVLLIVYMLTGKGKKGVTVVT